MFFESTRRPGETHVASKDPAAPVFYETHVPWFDVNDGLPKKLSQSSQLGSPTSARSPSASGPSKDRA